MDEKDLMIQELKAEIRAMAPLCRTWISTDERMPDAFEAVLVARDVGPDKPLKVEQGMYVNDGNWKVYGTRTRSVRFWMPLPEPPEVTE